MPAGKAPFPAGYSFRARPEGCALRLQHAPPRPVPGGAKNAFKDTFMEETFAEIWLPHYVSYGETDAMGVVYYAEYIHYFERARGAMCREAGLGYGKIEESGFMLPVREVECRYRCPAHYDELLQIHARIVEWRRASVRFQYEIYNEDRTKVLCEGMPLHAVVNREGRPVAVPAWIRETLSRPRNAEKQEG